MHGWTWVKPTLEKSESFLLHYAIALHMSGQWRLEQSLSPTMTIRRVTRNPNNQSRYLETSGSSKTSNFSQVHCPSSVTCVDTFIMVET
jgi:hypothetical protein